MADNKMKRLLRPADTTVEEDVDTVQDTGNFGEGRKEREAAAAAAKKSRLSAPIMKTPEQMDRERREREHPVVEDHTTDDTAWNGEEWVPKKSIEGKSVKELTDEMNDRAVKKSSLKKLGPPMDEAKSLSPEESDADIERRVNALNGDSDAGKMPEHRRVKVKIPAKPKSSGDLW